MDANSYRDTSTGLEGTKRFSDTHKRRRCNAVGTGDEQPEAFRLVLYRGRGNGFDRWVRWLVLQVKTSATNPVGMGLRRPCERQPRSPALRSTRVLKPGDSWWCGSPTVSGDRGPIYSRRRRRSRIYGGIGYALGEVAE